MSVRYRVLLVSMLGLSGCATGGAPSFQAGGSLECVPFARALTGIALHGDGPEWWHAAAGRYARSHEPEIGAIMVFQRTDRLPHGHVSVVSRIVSPREVWVTHANWVHGRVTPDEPVADVSSANDWSAVRVWWEPAQQLGATTYPIYGFIIPDRRMSHDAIAAATGRAARLAVSGGS